jgi:large subunit ribosomal protein L5
MMARLKKLYKDEIIPAMKKKFGYKNDLAVPKLEKIVINMGVGDAISDIKHLEMACKELAMICGQAPMKTYAKKSIAAFKLKAGMPIGCKVTLRGDRMYEFFDRLVNIALPRVRDFRGVSPNSFDGRGNYTLGIKEQIIFPEINYDKVERVRGMDVCIVTTASRDDEAKELLSLLGMPFRE